MGFCGCDLYFSVWGFVAVICTFVFGVLWLCVLCFVFGGRVCCVWCSCYKYYGSSTPAVFEFGVGLLGVFRMFGSMFCSCGSLFLFGQSGCLCGVCWCVLVFDVLPRFGFVRWLRTCLFGLWCVPSALVYV